MPFSLQDDESSSLSLVFLFRRCRRRCCRRPVISPIWVLYSGFLFGFFIGVPYFGSLFRFLIWVPYLNSLGFLIQVPFWVPYLGFLFRFLIRATYSGSFFEFLIWVPQSSLGKVYVGFAYQVICTRRVGD